MATKNRAYPLFIVLCMAFLLGGTCIPDDLALTVDASVGLDDATLQQVADINQTLATGIEVGPQTRRLIEEFNRTVADGVGLNEETLARLDRLIDQIEQGVKVGLDPDTLDRVDQLLATLARAPDQWRAVGQDVVAALEGATGRSAEKLGNEVKGILAAAEANVSDIVRNTGKEARCNVDFLSSKVGSGVEEFLGMSVLDLVRAVIFRTERQPQEPTPFVCHMNPQRIPLTEIGPRLIYQVRDDPGPIVRLTGFGFARSNLPAASIVDEAGQPVRALTSRPFRKSAYEIDLNLEGVDFAGIPPRSRIELIFPTVEDRVGLPLSMPAPEAAFSGQPRRGDAPLEVTFNNQSSRALESAWDFGDGEKTEGASPKHTYLLPGRYTVTLTARNTTGEDQERKVDYIVVTGEAAFPQANFEASPRRGPLPLDVRFTDRSSGVITRWIWTFGDGQSASGAVSASEALSRFRGLQPPPAAGAPPPSASSSRSPVHRYTRRGRYNVRLEVVGPYGQDAESKSAYIQVLDTPPVADFSASPTSGVAPLQVRFSDRSSGGTIVRRRWAFGNNTNGSGTNPVVTYSRPGSYTVTLEAQGQDESSTETKRGYIQVREAPQPRRCQLQTRVESGQVLRLVPQHQSAPGQRRGDRDFDGNGPCIRASVSLRIRSSNQVWASGTVEAWECPDDLNRIRSDYTYGRATLDQRLFSLSSGWRARRILSGTYSSLAYIDRGHGTESVTGSGAVRTWQIVGDVNGDDLGRTAVTMILNTIRVEQEEVGNCVRN